MRKSQVIRSKKKSKYTIRSKFIVRSKFSCSQNRRQKVFNRGALRFFRGAYTFVQGGLNAKTLFIYSIAYFNLGGLGALFGAAKPTKAPPWRRDCLQQSFFSLLIFF